MASTVVGVERAVLNGIDYRTKQGATLELGGVTKTSQYASGRRSGSSSEPMGSKLTATFEWMADTDVDAIRDFEGEAIYITDAGVIYSVPNAETIEPPMANDNGGGIEVTIEGDKAVRVDSLV